MSTLILDAVNLDGSIRKAIAHGSWHGASSMRNTLRYVPLKKDKSSRMHWAKRSAHCALIAISTCGVMSAVCVTSSGIIVTSISRPASKTMRAASGSVIMLNSATGFIFPTPIAPPMITMRDSLCFSSGYSVRANATFVRQPVATSATGVGDCKICSAMTTGALHPLHRANLARTAGSSGCGNNAVPSSPLSPWISGHRFPDRTSGVACPCTTSTVSKRAKTHTRAALIAVFCTAWFPWTVEIPMRERFGWWPARMMASMSSCPGSQSSQTDCTADASLAPSAHAAIFLKSGAFGYRTVQ
eukprot:m.316140 g.316140  ORF g.316140 m.316140 type:complete len:300 (+) comp27538_c1_seq1:1796-2695(+)